MRCSWRRSSGAGRVLLIGGAVLTVMLVDRDEHGLHPALRRPAPVQLGASRSATSTGRSGPAYRDFAYVAFTIGMTYRCRTRDAARSPDPAFRARPRDLVLSVRRGYRGGFGQPHLRTGPG
jgi:hypothetical protein